MISPDLELRLRAVVLHEYDSYCQRVGEGPCAPIAAALKFLGFGKFATLFAISETERDDCEDLKSVFDRMPDGCVCFRHCVVIQHDGYILDVALPPDFKVIGYELIDTDQELAGVYAEEEEVQFWRSRFNGILLESHVPGESALATST